MPSSSNAPSEDGAAADVKVERAEDSKGARGVDRQWPGGKGGGRRGRPPSSKRMKLRAEAGEVVF